MNSNTQISVKDNKPILVIGLGHTGINALLALNKKQIMPQIDYLAIDSDMNDLDAAQKADFPILQLGEETLQGAGTGGDWEMGLHLFEDISETLVDLSQNRRMIIIIAALAGGIGGAIEALLYPMSGNDVQILALVVMPFHFESNERKSHADEVLPQLSLLCRAIAIAPNDLITSQYPDCTPAQAFKATSAFLTKAATDFTIPLTCNNLFNTNPEIICSICLDSNPQCYLVQAEGSYQDICTQVAEHPLLKTPKFMDNLDKAIVLLRASLQCKEADLDNLLTKIAQMLPRGIMDVAACEDNTLASPMRITMMLHFKGVFHQSDPTEQNGMTTTSKRRKKSEEPLLFSNVEESLGIFANDLQPANKKDWLDLPTFVRQNITINKGELR